MFLCPIPAGKYHFRRYRLEAELAAKRKLNGQLTWWFGTFYGGNLQELEASVNWNPASILTFEFVGTHNIGRLPYGNFDQTLVCKRSDPYELGIEVQLPRLLDEQGKLQVAIETAGAWELDRKLEIAADALRLPPWDADVGNLFVLAMTSWKLGHEDEATAYHSRAEARLDETFPRNPTYRRLRTEAVVERRRRSMSSLMSVSFSTYRSFLGT